MAVIPEGHPRPGKRLFGAVLSVMSNKACRVYVHPGASPWVRYLYIMSPLSRYMIREVSSKAPALTAGGTSDAGRPISSCNEMG